MKTQLEVKHKVRALVVAELDRRVEASQERLPRLCAHNLRHALDARKTVDGDPNPNYNRVTNGKGLPVIQTIGLCGLGSENPEEWNGTICEEPADAQNCPYKSFTPKQTKDEIWAELLGQVKTPEWARDNMPAVAALTWAIDQAPEDASEEAGKVAALVRQVEVLEQVPERGFYIGPMNWLKRLIFKWLKIEVRTPPQLPEAPDDPTVGS